MGIVESMKGTLKATANVVTGKAANVAIETRGKLAPGEVIEVSFSVAAAGAAMESKGAFIELALEEDLHETMLEKIRELVLAKGEPRYVIQVAGPFKVLAGETKILAARFVMPLDLDAERRWFVRGRIQGMGVDPVSSFKPIAAH
jgi:hypothetical protein